MIFKNKYSYRIFNAFAVLIFCTNLMGMTLEEAEDFNALEEKGYSYNEGIFGYFTISMRNDFGMYDGYVYKFNENDSKLNCSKPLFFINDYKWKEFKTRNIGVISYGKFSNENLIKKIDEDWNKDYHLGMSAKVNSYLKDYIKNINSWDDYEKRVEFVLETYCNLTPNKFLIKAIDKISENLELGKSFDIKNFKGEIFEENLFVKKYKIYLDETSNLKGEIIVFTDANNIVFRIERKSNAFDSKEIFASFIKNVYQAVGLKYKYIYTHNETIKEERMLSVPEILHSEDNFRSADGIYSIEIKSFFNYDNNNSNPLKFLKESVFKYGVSEIAYTFNPIDLKIKNEIKEINELEEFKKDRLEEENKEKKIKSIMKEI